MTRKLATLALGSALALAAPLAHADQISYAGADTFTNSGSITFSNPALQIGTASGIFAPYTGSAATFTNFNFETYGAGSPEIIITDTSGANVLTFTLNTAGYSYSLLPDTQPGHAPGEEDLVILGSGTFNFNGTSTAQGSFDLNTQGVPGGPATVSFAETSYSPVTATPEPSSLMLLGTGMLGTAGMFFRRRRNNS